MDVEVTVSLHLRNLLDEAELKDLLADGGTLDGYVRALCEEDSIFNFFDGPIPGPDANIIGVKEWVS